jgi:hypothetical protein
LQPKLTVDLIPTMRDKGANKKEIYYDYCK